MTSKIPNKKLKKEDVKYLALEGGGGKGFAYLGAIKALEELKIFNKISGYAGASAGAITALLLSLGYNSVQIEYYLLHTNFEKFYDLPDKRFIPKVKTYEPLTEIEKYENEILDDLRAFAKGHILASFAYILSSTINHFDKNGVIKSLQRLILWLFCDAKRLGAFIDSAKQEYGIKSSKPPFNLLLKDNLTLHKYITYLWKDMGLFSGVEAREEFDRLIYDKIGIRNATFGQLYDKLHKELLVTGSNITTGQTQIFSHKNTYDFPVADAIRISMSLPIIFKPYTIEEYQGQSNNKGNPWPAPGTYVDGGVWNNLPFKELDQGQNPQTLGLRLTLEGTSPIKNLKDLITTWGKFVLSTGETQIFSDIDQFIILDTDGLSLIDFNPEEPIRKKAIEKAYKKTIDWFQ